MNKWFPIRDGDARGRRLYHRHYSCHHYKDGRQPKKFVGPGEYIALMTKNCKALFVWRRFIDASGQKGVNCAVFRNEGPYLSSALIQEACQIAWRRWPGKRLYTYVNAQKIQSPNPGYCFKAAGWKVAGKTKGGLIILEIMPEDFIPEPATDNQMIKKEERWKKWMKSLLMSK